MGFEIYHVQPLPEGRFALHRQGPLALGGPEGLLARHLPALAALDEQWRISPETLLQWAEIPDPLSHGIFFDLTPKSKEQINLFALVQVSGRTVSLLTDLLFHFKVACATRNPAAITEPDGGWVLPDWKEGRDRFESLRLEGGTRGGTWAWSEPPQSASATVL